LTAATSDRNTRERKGNLRSFFLAAATSIPAGVMAALDATGNLVNGATSATLRAVGVTQSALSNPGAAGTVRGDVATGIFTFANSAAADQLARADIGSTCYIVDNATVAKTNGGGTRSAAGRVFDVDADGVWVQFV
jgi:hypothetical protein